MRIKAPDWTADDDRVLRAEYGGTPTDALAARLKRTPMAVRSRAGRLGVTHRATTGSESSTNTGMTYFPRYPQRVTRALSRLAESRPTPQAYEREKACILGALNDENAA